jgi:hypothetical protein
MPELRALNVAVPSDPMDVRTPGTQPMWVWVCVCVYVGVGVRVGVGGWVRVGVGVGGWVRERRTHGWGGRGTDGYHTVQGQAA